MHGLFQWGKSRSKVYQESPVITGAWGIQMEKPPPMLFGTLKFAQRCGAKTRNGGTCQNMPRQIGGRCRMHGGNSLRGPEHPRYKEGKYSKYKPVDIDELIKQYATQPADFSWLQDEPFTFDDLTFDFDLSDFTFEL
jgi:hypothetical protein